MPSRLTALDRRAGCCSTWPKPCSYHEGWEDGYEAAQSERAVTDAQKSIQTRTFGPLTLDSEDR